MSLYFMPEITSGTNNNNGTSVMQGCPLIPEILEHDFSLTINIEETHPENTLGQRLKKARMAKRMQIKEVAAAAGVTSQTIGSWENDKYKPNQPGKLKKVADVLEVSVEYLLDPLPANSSFGEKLIYYRWCQGWTQMQFAEELGISEDYLRDAEKGKDIASIHNRATALNGEFFVSVYN